MANFIITFISSLCIFWSGYVLGVSYAKRDIIKKMADNPESLIATLRKIQSLSDEVEEMKLGIELYAEERDNVWFLYNKKTNNFVAQGPTIEKALAVAHERFPGQVFFGEVESQSLSQQNT